MNNKIFEDEEDAFIGTEFQTPKGGVLKVVGIAGRNKNGAKIYTCECSICSKDKELFTEYFKSTKGNLTNNTIPCGCAFNPKWSASQNLIRAKRLSKDSIYVFGYTDSKYKGVHSKVQCKCKKCNHMWNSSVDNLVRGKGCPECAASALLGSIKSVDYTKAIKDKCTEYDYEFVNFTDEYKNPKSKLMYKCKLHGAITQSFEKFINNGCPKCGIEKAASKRLNKNALQNIIDKCSTNGYTFIGYDGEYKSAKQKFKYICPRHGIRTSTYDNFINADCNCSECGKELSGCYGYYENRLDDIDLLYILNFDNKYIKVGRTFNLKRRLADISKVSKENNISLEKYTIDIHSNIYNLEQSIHNHLKELMLWKNVSWSTECFNIEAIEHINKFLEGIDE